MGNKIISPETYEIYVRWILGDLGKLNKKDYLFKSIIIGIIKNYGTKFSLHSIAKQTEVKTHVTVSDYLDTLQSLVLINLLYQFNYNKKIPLFRKKKKSYFLDPFLFSVFNGYTLGKYQDYSFENKASLVEGIVCEALARRVRQDLDISSNLWFFTKKKETDFVLQQDKKILGIEVKYQNKVTKSDFNNYAIFKKRILLSTNDYEFIKEKNMLIIPVSLFLAIV
ncbi:DUF4143 domain-containing protein [Candidatus Woesearchaeota archaeon]|nr:DUF4143 domain-containing protein [Candidatus Woesearchaeota archaeon]